MLLSVYTARYAVLAALVIGVLAALPAAAQVTPYPLLVVTITDNGIETSIDQPSPGLYLVTVRNESSDARGIVMKGIDRGVSPFIRFSKILPPGQQQSFRWFFPDDRNIRLRDLLRCAHARNSCVVAGYGGFTTSLTTG